MIDLYICEAGFEKMTDETKNYILIILGVILFIPSCIMKFGYLKGMSMI